MGIYKCDMELAAELDKLTGEPLKSSSQEEVDEIIRTDIWPAFFQTTVGQNLKANYESSQALNDTVVAEMTRRFGEVGKIRGGVDYPGAFFVRRLEEVIGDLIAVKHPSLVGNRASSPVATPQATEAEQLEVLKEQVRADIGDPFNGIIGISTLDIEAKKRTVPGYKQAFDAVQTESVEDGYKQGARHEVVKAEPPAEIKSFAHLLNTHIAQNGVPRANAGFYTLKIGDKSYEYPFAKFNEMSNAAVEFGLVR